MTDQQSVVRIKDSIYGKYTVSNFCFEMKPCLHSVIIKDSYNDAMNIGAIKLAKLLFNEGLLPTGNFMHYHFSKYMYVLVWKDGLDNLFDTLIEKKKELI